MDSQTARTRLEQMLQSLEASSTTLEREGAGDSSELSHVDQHPADTASEVSDMQRESAVLDVMDDQRSQVKAALARLDAGTYGRCIDCGKELTEDRLDARPEAARCVEDQQRFEDAAR